MNTLREKLEKMEVAISELKEAIRVEVRPGLLSGKVAIQVNNELEFNLLMENYEAKGWETAKYIPNYDNTFVAYQDTYMQLEIGCNAGFDLHEKGYNGVPFSDFAAEVGIKVPVFVMTSEDGVQLYSGMEMFGAKFSRALKTWSLNGFHLEGMPFILSNKNVNVPEGERFPYIEEPDHYKAFSTKQAAESWILEANKPKELECKLFGGKTANIHLNLIKVFDGNNTMNLKPSDLEDMLHAYKTISKS